MASNRDRLKQMNTYKQVQPSELVLENDDGMQKYKKALAPDPPKRVEEKPKPKPTPVKKEWILSTYRLTQENYLFLKSKSTIEGKLIKEYFEELVVKELEVKNIDLNNPLVKKYQLTQHGDCVKSISMTKETKQKLKTQAAKYGMKESSFVSYMLEKNRRESA